MNAVKKDHPLNPSPKKTIAIMQMTRFGDILQTYQAALEVKKIHGDVRLVFIGRKKFTTPLSFLLEKVFDKIFLFDFPEILNKGKNLEGVTKELFLFADSLTPESIDVLVNLTFSKSSAYLSHLIRAEHKLGMIYNERNELQIRDRWSQFVYSNVMTGPHNPFNLVDVFKFILGVKPKAPLYEETPSSKPNQIVIHPFASQGKKHWRTNKWVEILFKVLRENENATVTIVGDKNEMKSADQIQNALVLAPYLSRIKNLTGKISLEELSTLFGKQTLFVGHDSMVGHLASIFGSKTITVSLGTVRPSETTPYGHESYNIAPRSKCFPCFPTDACELHACHADIPYQVVSGAISLSLQGQELNASNMEKATSLFHLSSVDIFKGVFTTAGILEARPILSNELSSSDIFRKTYRILWLYLFLEKEEVQNFPRLNGHVHKELLARLSGLQQLFELCEFGKKYSRFVLEEIKAPVPSIMKLKDYSKKIDEVDQLQTLIKKTHPQLAPMIDHLLVEKGNLEGDNLVTMTENSFLTYDSGSIRASIVFELIEKILTEHKLKTNVGKTLKEDYHR